ncbi:MAG: hypothetical protein O7E52_30180, partial [Candidatus Poribacteria bacterium]|nr:hypothetical protein [Candidatus Poribacteria bacterium]
MHNNLFQRDLVVCGKFMPNQPVVTIEKWFTDGWKLYKKNPFTFFFASVLAALICIPPLFIFFAPPLYAGLYYMALKSMRREDPRIRDIFKGFGRYWGAFFLWLIFALSIFLLAATGVGILFVPLVWAVSMLAFPLLIDEEQTFGAAFGAAFKTVFRFTWKDWWGSLKNWGRFWLYGLTLTLISFLGIVGCFIGIFITLPLTVCVQVIAYREIFKPEEAFQLETAEPWQRSPFKLKTKYIGPISRVRELRDRIFEAIESANENVRTLMESSIEHIDSVFAKAANLIYRLQQIDDYLQTTDLQKLHAEKTDITRKLAEAPNTAVYSQYSEALATLEERIENHERIEELAAQINAQLTTIRVSLDNTYAKIIRIKTAEISNARFASDDVSKELRNLQ